MWSSESCFRPKKKINNTDAPVVEETTPVAVEETVETTQESVDLGSMKLAELKAYAKAQGLTGYSTLKKNELIELLSK